MGWILINILGCLKVKLKFHFHYSKNKGKKKKRSAYYYTNILSIIQYMNGYR